MITIDIEQDQKTGAYVARAEVNGQKHQAMSVVDRSALRRMIDQLAAMYDDQKLQIFWPTVHLVHRSLWDLAGIKNREEREEQIRQRELAAAKKCSVCKTRPVAGHSQYCSDRCKMRASRARRKEGS